VLGELQAVVRIITATLRSRGQMIRSGMAGLASASSSMMRCMIGISLRASSSGFQPSSELSSASTKRAASSPSSK
jgi:hypothetical protein